MLDSRRSGRPPGRPPHLGPHRRKAPTTQAPRERQGRDPEEPSECVGARERGAFSEWEPETAQEGCAERQRENEVGGQEETQGEKMGDKKVEGQGRGGSFYVCVEVGRGLWRRDTASSKDL